MTQKKMVFTAPFPPHGGGIANYSAMALSHLGNHLPLLPLGFRRVFPGRLFSKRETGDLPGIRRPFTGYLPWTWLLRRGWLDGCEPAGLLMPTWTAWLGPCLYTIARSFRYYYPDLPVILWCHNVVGHGEGMWSEMAISPLYGQATHFLTHASEETRRLAGLGISRERIETLFLPLHPVEPRVPVGEAREELGIEEPKHLLYYGTFRPYKGLDTLLEAFRRLSPTLREKTRLTLAGEVWHGMEGLADAFRREGAHLVEGYLDDRTTGLLFSSADLAVLPYREATGSGVLMMAMEAGLPAVVSDLPSLREYVDDGLNGLLFPPGDPTALAERLREALTGDRLARLRETLPSVRGRFTWERWCEKLLRFVPLDGILDP